MIRVILCLCIALWCLLPIASQAADGVECELAVYQTDVAHDSANVLLLQDTASFVKGIRANGFLVSFSLEIEFQRIDTSGIEFTTEIVTLGPPANNYSRQFRSTYGLPARVGHIAGKHGAQYTLSIRPIRPVSIDTSGCKWVHYRESDFKFDPSANVDIYYVPQTAGDFYWNGVKGLMEDRYRQFADLNKFNLPGKYLLYLCPCQLYSVIWDKRFSMMVDPTKLACYSIFQTNYNTADPFLLMYASAARHYGYAPPFVLEGFAGYLSLAHWDMKRIVAGKKQLPLPALLTTHRYMTADPYIADRTAASFVRYLIDQYKFDKFLRAYRAADDINLAATLEQTYGKPVTALETEWLKYIDTVTVRPELFGAYADQAEAMFNYPLMLRYRTDQLPLTNNHKDSMYIENEIVRSNLFLGNYADALKWQSRVVAMDTTVPTSWMSLGAYKMMLGQYDLAKADLEHAQRIDTARSAIISFNIALHHLIQGDSASARTILQRVVDSTAEGTAILESRLLLASILQRSPDKKDRDRALELYHDVTTKIGEVGKTVTATATLYLWGGIAALGEGDTGNAQTLLSTSLYYEPRPFYQALAYLWLGKTADVRGERDIARQNYRKVLELPAAAYYQAEAKALLEKRYTQ